MAAELERADALRALGLVDGEVEPEFTRLANLAITVTRAPMCVLAFGNEPEKLIKAYAGPPEMSPGDVLSIDLYRELLRGNHRAFALGKVAGAVVHTPSGLPIGAWCARTVKARTWTQPTLDWLESIATLTQTELAVREMHRPDERAARILESMSDACVFLDRDFRYAYVNRKAGEIFRRSPRSLLGKHIWTEFPEGVGQRFDLAYQAAVRTQQPISIEEYYPPWKRWFENRIYPGPDGLAIFFQDVTERREAQEEHRKEAVVRAHAEQMAHLGFWVWNIAENKLRGSEELYRIYAIEEASFAGTFEAYLARVHPLDRNRVRETVERGVRDRSPVAFEERIVRPGGEIRHLHSWGSVVEGGGGQALEMRGACLDLTELILTTEGLRRTGEWLSVVLETAGVAVFEVNVNTQELRWAGAAERVLGIPADEIGSSYDAYLEHLTPDDRDSLVEAARVSIEKGTALHHEHRLTPADGLARWVEVRARPFLDATCRVTRLVGTVDDVTDRHQAEDQRRKLEKELHLAQKMEAIGRLAYSVAHDFNNLLTVIRNSTTLLLGRDPDPDERWTLQGIEEAAIRATELIKQLLAFSKLQAVQRGPVDLDQVVRDETGTLERLLPDDVHLVLSLSPDILPVLANRSQLDQVLLNLVVNARDAMPNGGTLTIATRPGSGFAELEVGDTGVGMSPDVRARAFEPFYTTKDTGNGIGLATVYGIVTASGGTIELESEPGKGSSFVVRLPVAV